MNKLFEDFSVSSSSSSSARFALLPRCHGVNEKEEEEQDWAQKEAEP